MEKNLPLKKIKYVNQKSETRVDTQEKNTEMLLTLVHV